MKKKLKWILKLGFTASLFVLIFNPSLFGIKKQFIPVTLEGLWAEIQGIDVSLFWKWILAAAVIKALGMLSSMIRWNLLLKGQAIKLPFSHLVGTFLVGRFFGMFLPSTIGLDGYRLYDVAKHTGKAIESTTVILIEKLTGLITLTFLVFITLPLGLRFLPIKPLVLAVILAFLAVFIAASFVLLFNPRIIQILLAIVPLPGRAKIRGKIDNISQAVTAYSNQKKLLGQALVFGFFVHFCTALMYFGTAMAINTRGIDILDILFTSPLMIYGTVIGPSIGGEGIREIIFALILGAKAGTAKTILFAHLGFWVGEILSLAGGFIYILRPAEYRPKSEEIQDVIRSSKVQADRLQVSGEELQRVKKNIHTALRAGVFSGIWAGFLMGLVEALIIVFSFDSLPERSVLYWAPLGYGLLGCGMGAAFGCAAGVRALFRPAVFEHAKVWSLGFAAVFVPLLLVIGRFRIVRDILHERPLSLLENAALLAAAAVLFAVLYKVFSLLIPTFKSIRVVPTGYGAPVAWGVFLMCLGGYNVFTDYYTGKAENAWVAPPFKPTPNVIMVMVDALRADHLPVYGYQGISTPGIDRLAGDGIVFTHHIAQSSWTKPQSASLLTALYPSTHNTYLKPHVLPEKIETLPEVMQKTGYHTAGIVSNINLSPVFNFQQGFDHYCYLSPDYYFFAKESSSKLCLYNILRLVRARFLSKRKKVNHFYQNAETVNERTLAWLDKSRGDPFFLFLHYMDPHDPYFSHPYNGEAIARVSRPNPPPELAERMRVLYDQEIVYFDRHFSRLLDYLQQNDLYDDCLIVFTADHGEEFYDHGGWWHGTSLFEEQINIPLIVKLPRNKRAGTTDSRLVRSIDIAPSIIQATGGSIPPAMQGANFLTEDAAGVEAVYSEEDHENNVIRSIRTDRWKLIVTEEGSPRMPAPVQLFDMRSDPQETVNLAETHPDIVKALRQKMDTLSAEIKRGAYKAEEGSVDTVTRERLKALGYVE